jgi:hypothetical protein
MFSNMTRLGINSALLLVIVSLAGIAPAAEMETVKVSSDKQGFVLQPSGER